MSSLFRYPGGKTKLLPEIIKEIKRLCPNLRHYREPFFGGGSVGLAVLDEFPIEDLWINDKDIGIYCIWASIVYYPEEFKDRIHAVVPSVQLFKQYKDYTSAPDLTKIIKWDLPENTLDIAIKKLVVHQMSYSGLGTKSRGPLGGWNQNENTKYPINCRWNPENICKKISSIRTKLWKRHIIVTLDDFKEVVLKPDHPNDTLIYLDPPYYNKGNELYQCGFTINDHYRFATSLKECKVPWLLSYDDCEEIRRLYDSWAIIKPVTVNYTINTKNGSRNKSELLISPF
jgi:DNA adenine methylase